MPTPTVERDAMSSEEIRLVNLLKRLIRLAEQEKSYSLKAVAEEVEASVLRLLKAAK